MVDNFALKFFFSSSSLTSSVLFSEIIIFNLLAKLYGMLFLYVLGGMMCIKDTVLNRSVYNKYLFEAVHFLL